MASVIPLQQLFNAGMKRDYSRNRMPPNSCWNLVDTITDYDAPARERGGWSYASNDINAVTATNRIICGIYSIFATTAGADPQNLAVNEQGELIRIAESGVPTLVTTGAAAVHSIIKQPPIFHGGAALSGGTVQNTGLVIFMPGLPNFDSVVYNGTTVRTLHSSHPKAQFGTVYKDYFVMGNGTVGGVYYPNRIWFSEPGDPDVALGTPWDTTDSWQEFSLPVEGLASVKNAILIFHRDRVSRMRGNTPPPDEDMVVDDPFQKVGLLDPFSIIEHQDLVYWCAPEGVFRTDAVSLDDITLKGGMLRYWLDLVSDATTAWRFATAIHRGKLFIAISNNQTGAFIDAFMIDMSNYAWSRLTNMNVTSFWDGLLGQSDEEYFGIRGLARVGRLETIFKMDSAAVKNDANGVAVASVMETPFYELGPPGLKVVNEIYTGYYLLDHASDNPRVDVSYITSPEQTNYTALGSLSENTVYQRLPLQVGGRMPGIGFKFTRVNAGDFRGYDLGVRMNPLEQSKR